MGFRLCFVVQYVFVLFASSLPCLVVERVDHLMRDVLVDVKKYQEEPSFLSYIYLYWLANQQTIVCSRVVGDEGKEGWLG